MNNLSNPNPMQQEILLDVQIATQSDDIPSVAEFKNWVSGTFDYLNSADDQALIPTANDIELTIRVVGEKEIQSLNKQYRQKDNVTNVLSFPYEAMPGVETGLLGDIIICAQVVNQEADEQGKQRQHHWTHMVTHGILHLLGLDHLDEQEAEHMEMCEINILNTLGITDPYKKNENQVMRK